MLPCMRRHHNSEAAMQGRSYAVTHLICHLAAQQVVAELSEPFAPLPDDLLVNLKESRPVIDALLESMPTAFSHTGVVRSSQNESGLFACSAPCSAIC